LLPLIEERRPLLGASRGQRRLDRLLLDLLDVQLVSVEFGMLFDKGYLLLLFMAILLESSLLPGSVHVAKVLLVVVKVPCPFVITDSAPLVAEGVLILHFLAKFVHAIGDLHL